MNSSISFSESILATKVVLSPNGYFVAYTVQNHEKLWIRSIKENLTISETFVTILSNVDQIEWSIDSVYIACGSIDQALIQIFSLDDKKWKCKIDIGNGISGGVGLLDFCWSRMSRHLLTTACHHIQLTIWSLVDKDVHSIRDILPIEDYKSFSPDGKELAVAKFDVCDSGKKFVHIYDISNWKCNRRFNYMGMDLKGLKWYPDKKLLIWDSVLFSNIYIYSSQGDLLNHCSPDGNFSRGIQSIDSSPTGQFIAFINHKNQLRLMNTLSYGMSLDETLNISLISHFPTCILYSEQIIPSSHKLQRKYEIKKHFQGIEKSIDRMESGKITIPILKFSWDGKLISAYTPTFPNILWIWDISTTKLTSVLQQQQHIKDFCWHPFEDYLCLVTMTEYLYFWSPPGSSAVQIPNEDFYFTTINWSSDGNSIIVTDSEKFTICNFSNQQ